VDLATREEELEEVTDALLVTESDDFNALAAHDLRRDLGHDHVYRLPAGGDGLTYRELTRRRAAGPGETSICLSPP
jgi:hypothetical protein